MPTGFPIILTDKEETDIINYYLADHSIGQTTEYFNFTNRRVVVRTLDKYNIKRHSKEKLKAIHAKSIQQACLKKYNVNNVSQLQAVKNKKQETSKKHFGTLNTTQAKEVKDKIRQTNLEKYGVPCSLQAEQIKVKTQKTCLEKFGTTIPQQNIKVKEKTKQTCIEKYGVPTYAMTKAYHIKKQTRYVFNNEHFDSFPELCFYMYYFYTNQAITHLPLKLSYFFDNVEHYYFPDFKIDNQLIEIKSDYLFNKMQEENTLSNAKYKCMLENNVNILLKNDYKFYINWFKLNNFDKKDYKN